MTTGEQFAEWINTRLGTSLTTQEALLFGIDYANYVQTEMMRLAAERKASEAKKIKNFTQVLDTLLGCKDCPDRSKCKAPLN